MENNVKNTLSQKEKEAIDRKLELLEPKIADAKHKYDDLVSRYAELYEMRHPEKKAERIKNTLYQAYINGNKSLEQILAYISGDEDLW